MVAALPLALALRVSALFPPPREVSRLLPKKNEGQVVFFLSDFKKLSLLSSPELEV